MPNVLTCITCVHATDGRSHLPVGCQRPIATALDPVTGATTKPLCVRASWERARQQSFWSGHERCGPDARFWQQIPASTMPAPSR